ncbi:hypothetical protein [Exiguobacterium oxidotolerans]|uniref:Uncharacterized protein n=1 Tax=Exiguobacterium oxidotolerans TaxID=223958 RepID=A0A653I711_9BACL|nr:hypothetical protein [Exiguobacterium oxidotolerans]VWX34591.1 conserved hypothetical protein [Exiguobacterium oxidotolerans]
MKKWIGLIILVQTILFGMLIVQLDKMTDTIAAVGAYIATNDGDLTWGGGLPVMDYVLFGILIIVGIFLLIPEEKLK